MKVVENFEGPINSIKRLMEEKNLNLESIWSKIKKLKDQRLKYKRCWNYNILLIQRNRKNHIKGKMAKNAIIKRLRTKWKRWN